MKTQTKLLSAKTLKDQKLKYYEAQKGICCLCNNPLSPDVYSNHLDHDHALEGPNAGKVRGLLCNLCNALEGQIKHKFNRSGLKDKVDMLYWLNNLQGYLSQDLNESMFHPRYVPDMVKKFSRLTKPEMETEIIRLSGAPEGDKKALVNQYRKLLRKSL